MPPLARTNEEAHLYIGLRPCICGAVEFGASSSVSQVDGTWVARYDGRCAECGRTRVFEFRQPEQIVLPEDDAWAVGDQPSELLDAGEWLYVADGFGGDLTDPTELSETECQQVSRDLRAAAAAVDEVLKFLPPGAEQVPDTAFWSHRGLRIREAEPGRFRRLRLEAARDTYRRLAAELAGQRP